MTEPVAFGREWLVLYVMLWLLYAAILLDN